MVRLIAVVVAVVACQVLTPLGASAQVNCQFTLGFLALRDKIPDVVGECLENERFEPSTGSVHQRTTGGLLSWRRADGWSTFTDGVTLWIDGPEGVSIRPYARPRPAALPAARAGAAPPSSLRQPWWDVPAPGSPIQRRVPPEGVPTLPPWARERALALILASLDIRPSATYGGSTSLSTPAFNLGGGRYTAHWFATALPDRAPCTWAGTLRNASGQGYAETFVSTSVRRRDGIKSGMHELPLLMPGAYYVDVTSLGCEWSVTFTPSEDD